MRRSIGLALVGLGVLMLVAAPLLRWYAYPRLAVVSDAATEQISTGQDVTVLDRAAVLTQEGPMERSTDVRSVRRIVPDVAAGTDDRAVWETSVTTVDTQGDDDSAEPDVLAYLEERVAFDRHGGYAVEGGEQYISRTGDEADAEPIEHAGYLFKLPFGTEKRDYDFWDAELRATRPMTFVAADQRGDLDVYRFEQRIEPTVIAQMEVPGALFDRSGAVKAEHVYSATRTIWVEPYTGAIIDGRHELDSFLRFDGERGPAVVQGTLAYTDDQVAANIAEYSGPADELALVRDTLPLGGLVAGAVVLIAGVVVAGRKTESGRRRLGGSASAPGARSVGGAGASGPEPSTVSTAGEPEPRAAHPTFVAEPDPVVLPEPEVPLEPTVPAVPSVAWRPEQPGADPAAAAGDPPATEPEPAAADAGHDLSGPRQPAGRGADHDLGGHDLAEEFDEFDEDAQGPGPAYRY
ncbi:porin PorA family protein [Haloactinopolyspora sp.]|uniref:porin PorA family protein n=1 Tax=Haloactinopolyspora sp. TaxID=1966353 RepID=UPI00260FFCBC|nr:porin PorA family protein [Haloactinopolyspora sp.]